MLTTFVSNFANFFASILLTFLLAFCYFLEKNYEFLLKKEFPPIFFSLNYLAVACASPDNMLKFFWPLLTLNYYSQSFHILRQKMIISQVFLQQQNTPHFIVYFSENQKIKKTQQKSSPRDKDEWCFDHKNFVPRKKQKKQKLYFGQLPQHLTTSWLHEKKSDSQMSHFRSLFFRVFVKVSLKVTLKTKQKR